MERMDRNHNSNCRFCVAEENPEHLTLNYTTRTEMRANHLGKDFMDEVEKPSLK